MLLHLLDNHFKTRELTFITNHREMDIRNSTKDFINFTYLSLIFKIDRSIEIRNLQYNMLIYKTNHFVCRFTKKTSFSFMHHITKL